ncbi:MAG: hypothetical protein JWM33_2591 [Caulobacteraceae bacterium]|nr:hypothetical protein [Caulobacteraceae bacterium]
MILSVAHRLVLVRGLKVGGTSVEMALSTICGPDDIVTPLLARDERDRQAMGGRCGNYSDNPMIEAAYVSLVNQSPPEQLHRLKKPAAPYSAHTALSQIVRQYPGSLEGFRVVCLTRCPYARVLSALNMGATFAAYQRGGLMASEPATWQGAFDRAVAKGSLGALNTIDLYRDADGGVSAQVLRYETLERDFDALLASLGVTSRIALPHAKKGLMSNTLDPSDVLRRDQIELINANFAEEFEVFGYPRR